ncbi:hypothetical protein K457DRAFT_136646 [Linnemannia elongata AG-77]|uniref:rRNA-processing protein EFG1 n=1 Tax=Linnemannia elongata AG-77 TaxID=1314771 RepID=A0A197K0L9_9FUNG|nr:hypothetical protein K457DRAFT_136646 [Linnemannia elongata AG-77]
MDSKADAGAKKKFVRKVAPSKAPGRVLKKQLRNMERLLKNKDTLKDLPAEVVAETEKKIAEVKKKIEALGPQSSPESAALAAPKSQINSNSVAKGGIKATELRRAGRKIVAFKKQHPNHGTSEAESKELVELELDLMYIKHFPKTHAYIPIYSEDAEQDESQVKVRTQIREDTRKALENGKIKKSTGGDKPEGKTEPATGKHPISNWSDDDDEEGSNDEEEDERETKKQKKD